MNLHGSEMNLEKSKTELQKSIIDLPKSKTDLEKSAFFENFNGIVLINKKSGMTSFDVIRRFKRFFF